MRPFSLGVTTLIQGLYALVWVAVMFDVASPTFNLGGLPSWTGMQGVFGDRALVHGGRGPRPCHAYGISRDLPQGQRTLGNPGVGERHGQETSHHLGRARNFPRWAAV